MFRVSHTVVFQARVNMKHEQKAMTNTSRYTQKKKSKNAFLPKNKTYHKSKLKVHFAKA